MRVFKGLLLFLLLLGLLPAQFSVPPPLRGMIPAEEEVDSTKPADSVVIQGKKADQLSDEETRDFLQGKIRTISQRDGEVELLRIAPGYPMTLSFSELPQTIILGDPKMVGYQKVGKTVVLSATTRQGDTSLQVFFAGGKLRVYHLFIEPDFVTGETSVRVTPFLSDVKTSRTSSPDACSLTIKEILDIVRNYDLMTQEKSLHQREVRRFDLFRKSRYPNFTYFALYRFASGPVVITFSYENSTPVAVRVDESKIRMELGHRLFVPDFVSFHKILLKAGERTTGLVLMYQPPFSVEQSFELVNR